MSTKGSWQIKFAVPSSTYKLPWHCSLLDNLFLHLVQSALPSPSQQIYQHRHDKFHLVWQRCGFIMIVSIKFFELKDKPYEIKHCLHIKQKGLTSMTQNRNFSGTLDLRNKFVAASRNYQINYVIQLKGKYNANCEFHLQLKVPIFTMSKCINQKLISTVVFTLSSSALVVTSPISFPPTVSGMASVITCNFRYDKLPKKCLLKIVKPNKFKSKQFANNHLI